VTGWGQEGPLAHTAGHDINYIALAGALDAIGEKGRRAVPPLNLIGDFGGGSMLLAFGIVAALFERRQSALGQVVDAAIVDGVSSLMTFFDGLDKDRISLDRNENMLAGGAHPHMSARSSHVLKNGRVQCAHPRRWPATRRGQWRRLQHQQ
jgi:alpha-methylacyl-CoA racemase